MNRQIKRAIHKFGAVFLAVLLFYTEMQASVTFATSSEGSYNENETVSDDKDIFTISLGTPTETDSDGTKTLQFVNATVTPSNSSATIKTFNVTVTNGKITKDSANSDGSMTDYVSNDMAARYIWTTGKTASEVQSILRGDDI